MDCTVAEITADPMIDYGVVYYQEDASRLVVVRNIADGNAPLTVDDVYLTNYTVSTLFPLI